MRLLAIETSCDETAIAILECEGGTHRAHFRILGNALLSQIDIHKEYGGVFPALAKREHAKNLVPLLEAVLEEAELEHESTQNISEELRASIRELLAREPGLADALLDYVSEIERPAIDAITVTKGPGLEPALWVGINFARALSLLWNIPIVGVNHMEGHLLAALAEQTDDELRITNTELPVLALLISGGHTELVLMKDWCAYELIGATRDDAVGEAFDKVARMMGLPYPGGPEISKLAELSRGNAHTSDVPTLPRPMLHDATCDFSFSGLKTAVLYFLKDKGDLPEEAKQALAEEFENAVTDVLWEKTARALSETNAHTLVIGGGVSANTHIRRVLAEHMEREYPQAAFRVPSRELTTDNAVMIGVAGFYRALRGEYAAPETLRADGNLPLA